MLRVIHFGSVDSAENAPITRIFVIACAVFTVLAGMRGHSATSGVSYQVDRRYYRVILCFFLVSGYFVICSSMVFTRCEYSEDLPEYARSHAKVFMW